MLWLLPWPLNFALLFSLFHVLNIIFMKYFFKEYIFRSLLSPRLSLFALPRVTVNMNASTGNFYLKKHIKKLVTWKIIIYVVHNSTVCQFEPSSAEKFSSSRMVSLMPPQLAVRWAGVGLIWSDFVLMWTLIW